MNKIIIQGIQWDEKSSYQQGPSKAPPLIREALHCGSSNSFTEALVSIEDARIIDEGDFEIADYFEIETITAKHLSDKDKILTLGGDHSITYPIIKAYHQHYGKFDILQFDAHGDLYDNFEGDPYSHACPFARIMESGLVNRLVQVGVRALNPHQMEQAKKFNVKIHPMKNLDIAAIPKFENPVYISLDMDGFDPAFAPGVSHHEPGGLTTRQVLDTIQGIDKEIIGADIVEYNPDRDFQNMTAFLAAKMMRELLGKMLKQN